MELSPPWEADRLSAGNEMPKPLGNSRAHIHVGNRLPSSGCDAMYFRRQVEMFRSDLLLPLSVPLWWGTLQMKNLWKAVSFLLYWISVTVLHLIFISLTFQKINDTRKVACVQPTIGPIVSCWRLPPVCVTLNTFLNTVVSICTTYYNIQNLCIVSTEHNAVFYAQYTRSTYISLPL